MNRKKELGQKLEEQELLEALYSLKNSLNYSFKRDYNRSLPFNELLFDRWKRAKELGFGVGTSIYDNSLVFGDIQVGENCWIGPFTILDGSGGLKIGNHCTISSGVHIYSHDNIKQTLTSGKVPIERKSVRIGNNTYVGPNTIISKGVKIGDFCVIGAQTFVKSDIPDYSIVVGQPGKKIGIVEVKKEEVSFNYK